jgi:hypothetical protein
MTRGKAWALAFLAAVGFIAFRLAGVSDFREMDGSRLNDIVGAIQLPQQNVTNSAPTEWARPLFSKALPETMPGIAEAPAIAEASPRLAGIILVSGRRTALITVGGATHRVETGAMVGKWRIARIDRRSVSLEAHGIQQILTLDPVKAEE